MKFVALSVLIALRIAVGAAELFITIPKTLKLYAKLHKKAAAVAMLCKRLQNRSHLCKRSYEHNFYLLICIQSRIFVYSMPPR